MKVDVTSLDTQSGGTPRATNSDQRRPSVPPSATSATPATPKAVPRLPRQTQVDVSKCHPCHAKWRSPRATNGDQRRPSAPPHAIDVTLCHACHAKSGAAPRATNGDQRRSTAIHGDQARHQVQQVPRLPRQMQVDVSKCHTCHANRR